MPVDHGDHVSGVLSNQMKKPFPLRETAADTLELQVLIDGVYVEQ
jgi:hypothetical protein